MNYFLKAFKLYAQFRGRATRSEFWYFILFYFLISLFLCILTLCGMFTYFTTGGKAPLTPFSMVMVVVLVLFYLGTLLPMLAVSVRRLHDIGLGGQWLLGYYIIQFVLKFLPSFIGKSFTISLVVFIIELNVAFFFIFFLYCKDSEKGENRFGPNPKGIGNPEVATEETATTEE